MKKARKWIIVVIVVLVAAAAGIRTPLLSPKVFAPEPVEGVLHDLETDEKTAYTLEILPYGSLKSGYLKSWVDRKMAGKDADRVGYHAVYHGDRDTPVEMYLLMPQAKEIMGDITLANIKASQSGALLTLNISTEDGISRKKESTDLILHLFVKEGEEKAAVKSVILVVNGKTYACLSTEFSSLK